MELSARRSIAADVPHIDRIISDDRFIYSKRFGAQFNLHRYIETNFLSITIIDVSNDRVVGFASFDDAPPQHLGIPRATWPATIQSGWQKLENMSPGNAVWLCFIASMTLQEDEIVHQILTTALATLAQIDYIMMALPDDVPPFSPVCDILAPCNANTNTAMPPKIRVYKTDRADIIPELLLRVGVVEDYDDLMPLLESGDGVVTPLPDNLYLEELLQNQDEWHAVVVGVDRSTNRVVGLMCLQATYDEQQHAVKQYATDHYQKLKPIQPQTTHRGQQAGHNMVHITFFYLNPAYDSSAKQFVPQVFTTFPFAEYCVMYLPHAAPVHPVLHDFTYVPIKKLQPSNVQGERLPLPQGLYVFCRYALEPISVVPVSPTYEAAVTKMMQSQNELSQDLSEATCVAFTQSVPVGSTLDPDELPYKSFVALWRDSVVGVVVLSRCPMEEMYAVRSNFDLAKFVNFDPDGDTNYFKSDIGADPLEAPLAYRRDSLPGVTVRYCYLKPIVRCRLRQVLRDVLRLSDAELLLYPALPTEEVFTPLVSELILAPPRWLPVFPLSNEGTENPPSPLDPLLVLHFTSRRLLSDEKTQINARIVVVGSGTTGLAFIYALLQLPYLNFANVTLISQDGLPKHPQQRDLLWAADTMEWSEREYMSLKVGRKVRIIEGTMIDFDRSDQYIYTDNATCEPYDHLILTVGRQYAMPRDLDKQGAKRGVFPLANTTAINQIKQHIHESEIYEDERSRAVIYGANLDVYAVAACVTQLDLGPQRIVLVSPEDEAFNAFGDDTILRKVNELFDSLNIQRFTGHILKRCEYDEDNSLSSVFIAPKQEGIRGESKPVEIDATMLIYAHEKDIDVQVLSALNKRSIVFDGRVIVENCYRTTDRYIYAAGPVAMFSRRFGPCDDFDIFNTLEVGRHVCHTILGFLGIEEFVNADFTDDAQGYVPKDDPLAAQLGTFREAPPEDLARRRPKPLPVYTEPVSRRVVLPTGLIFFTCYSVEYMKSSADEHWTHLTSWSRETKPVAHDGSQDAGIAANVMRGPDGTEKCYVRVSVGPDGIIGAVGFLGRDTRNIDNLRTMVGMSQSTLNLLYNYAETKDADGNPALDILAYMESTWARAIFHDHFGRLCERVRDRLKQHEEVQALKEEMLQRLRSSGERHLDQMGDRKEALSRLTRADSDVRHLVELETIKFLHEHKAFLPQHYYLPDITAFAGPTAVRLQL